MSIKVLLFEGSDGAGKTTLIDNFTSYLNRSGKTFLLVGRDYNKPINTITQIIQDKELEVNSTSEILLRLARESERIKVVNQELNNYDYIILDRSFVSATSWIKYYNLSSITYSNIVSELVNSIGSCNLVYCFLSFEESWARTNSRTDKALSKKEEKGKQENEKIFNALREAFLNLDFPTVSKIEIQANKSKEDCISDLLIALNLK